WRPLTCTARSASRSAHAGNESERCASALHREPAKENVMRGRGSLALIAFVAILVGRLGAGPVAARDVGALQWHRAARSPTFEGALIAAVAAGPRGVVAVGGKLVAGRFEAVAWTSIDGERWRPAVVPDPAGVEFLSVTRWHDRFVAVGDQSVVRNGSRILDA